MIRNEFALDYTQSGLVISTFSLSYGIGQLPAGWLADRIGSRILTTISISGLALAGLFVGLSGNYVMLLVFLALMGLLGGGYHPAAPPLILSAVEEKNRGQALGLHMVGGSASYFLGPIIGTTIASLWSWRGSFIGLAIPIIAFGFLLYRLLGRRVPEGKTGSKETRDDVDASAESGRLRHLVIFLILAIFMGAVCVSIISFIPLYLVDHFSVKEGTAGALVGLVYSSGFWACPLGGYLSDRLGRVPLLLAICFMSGPVIYLLNHVPYGWGMFVLLALIGMIMVSRTPMAESYIIGQTPIRYRSTIMGIYYFGAIEGGGVLTPALGYLIDRLGFFRSFTISAASLMVVTLVCSIWLWRTPYK
jgi:MFS family permease